MEIIGKEDICRKISICSEIKRKTLDQKALIPKNLNIYRRSTLHTRVEKSFEDAYNYSPRSRAAKMKAVRKAQEQKFFNIVGNDLELKSSKHSQVGQKEIVEKMSSFYQKERVNTHKLLNKMSGFKKNIDESLEFLGKISCSKEIFSKKRRCDKLKENII